MSWTQLMGAINEFSLKGERVPRAPYAPCQCGKMLRCGVAAAWNCGPACVLPLSKVSDVLSKLLKGAEGATQDPHATP